jgi:glycine/D-amino acid oxidase-like deaminating enzyme
MTHTLPQAASVVVIGGGVMGTSIAFHLAEAGIRDILLIERSELGSGSTSRAAGGVRAMFADELNIRLGQRSLQAFADFATRPGQEIDLRRVGYLFLLSDSADLALFEASVELQNELGVRSRMVDAAEVRSLCPGVVTSDLVAGAFSPDDGYCAPESVVRGYATAATALGVAVERDCEVVGITRVGRRIASVETNHGSVKTNVVICAAGAWSSAVARMADVDLPVTPVRRQVLVTEPVATATDQLPMTIDYTTTLYFHGEGPGMLIGMADPEETPGFKLDPSDEWLAQLSEPLGRRAPWLLDVGVKTQWAGLYEVSPDSNAIIGESHDVDRFLYATGFSGHGFLQGPAVGEVIRDLYLGVRPDIDVAPLSADRFAAGVARVETHCI